MLKLWFIDEHILLDYLGETCILSRLLEREDLQMNVSSHPIIWNIVANYKKETQKSNTRLRGLLRSVKLLHLGEM